MSNQRGSVILVSYLIIVFLITWATVGFRQTASELSSSERYVNLSETFHLTEAGLDHALEWLGSLSQPPVGILAFDPCVDVVPAMCATCPCQSSNGTYTVSIDPDDNNPTSYVNLYTLTTTGVTAGVSDSRQITSIIKTESFSRYSYFTNLEVIQLPWGSVPIWFTSNDYVEGPVHTNDQLNIAGNPVFDGPVSSAESTLNYYNGGPPNDNPQFNGGLTLNHGTLALPMSASELRVAASTGGFWYDGNTNITLVPNSGGQPGSMLVTNADLGWVNEPQPLPPNGAIFVSGGNVNICGTLDGQLTIGTSNDVVVECNVVYADDPVANPNSDDVLGLVAEKNVVVGSNAPHDVTIQASVMAIDSSFIVENWWETPAKGTLNVYGGIIQDSRGPVGTFYSRTGQKRSGYSKDYHYDTRLSNIAPPFYPTTGKYEQVIWRED